MGSVVLVAIFAIGVLYFLALEESINFLIRSAFPGAKQKNAGFAAWTFTFYLFLLAWLLWGIAS